VARRLRLTERRLLEESSGKTLHSPLVSVRRLRVGPTRERIVKRVLSSIGTWIAAIASAILIIVVVSLWPNRRAEPASR
jgi:hypothetical protein